MLRASRTRALAGLSLALLAACGGGGGGGGASGGGGVPATGALVVLTPSLSFGPVAPGASAERTARVRNSSTSAAATLLSAALPAGGFSLPSTTLPLQVPAGATVDLVVRFAPTTFGVRTGDLRIEADVGTSPLVVALSGGVAPPSAGGSEVVTDFGSQAFSGGLTATLQVSVPSDAVSLTIEARPDGSALLGLGELVGPGGRVYENTLSTGAYIWSPSTDVLMATVPNTDQAAVQLVAGGGTYSFRVSRLGGAAPRAFVRAIVERRTGSSLEGTLDLNVWIAAGLAPTAATAASDARLQGVLARIDEILSQQGVRLGDIDYYDVTNPAYDEVTEAEFAPMLRLTSAAVVERLNLFLVLEAIGGGVVGVSPAVGGPRLNGTGSSGVMSVYDGFSTSTIGLIAAHEIGHYLGLYHTAEQDGSNDFVDDTADCPATGTGLGCPVEGGGYLMHWLAVGGTDITDGQGLVVRGHPLLAPGTAAPKPLRAEKAARDAEARAEAEWLSHGWCGTCSAAAARKPGR